ncbi:glutamate synthase central domain-containing protein [Shigella flexneri]
MLLGFGATAIYPYLAYETLAKQVEGVLKMSLRQAMLNYRNGINKGLYKVMSKMGISTVASYRCSQLFEAVGLSKAVVELCFAGFEPHWRGRFADIQQDQFNLARQAWLARKALTRAAC